MENSYISLYIHAVFRTKNDEPFLNAEITEKLYPYFGGVARDEQMRLLAVGGMPNHIHMLLSFPATISASRAMQVLKTAGARWIHENFPLLPSFGWQEGYGAFSIGISQVEQTKAYIARQAEHHRKTTFHEEYVAFLKKNNLPYEERYL